jgi:hypothetical protein
MRKRIRRTVCVQLRESVHHYNTLLHFSLMPTIRLYSQSSNRFAVRFTWWSHKPVRLCRCILEPSMAHGLDPAASGILTRKIAHGIQFYISTTNIYHDIHVPSPHRNLRRTNVTLLNPWSRCPHRRTTAHLEDRPRLCP